MEKAVYHLLYLVCWCFIPVSSVNGTNESVIQRQEEVWKARLNEVKKFVLRDSTWFKLGGVVVCQSYLAVSL